jgi:hypothetical protein
MMKSLPPLASGLALLGLVAGAGCRRAELGAQAAAASAAPQTQGRYQPKTRGHALDFDNGEKPGAKMRGADRWKDCGVYVDGQPRGFLSFGEMPIGARPLFVEERASAEVEPGSKSPGWRIVKERRYRVDQYLTAIGIDLKTVKEVHAYGPKASDAIVVSGKELRKRGAEFMFRFGTEVGGKPIPVVPPNFGNGRSPDKMSALMVYIDKKPPKLIWNQGFEVDGQIVRGVPYGEQVKGGVRVYLDDKLATILRRKSFEEETPAGQNAQGEPLWSLGALLAAEGVALEKVAEAYVIRDERRQEKLSGAELAKLTFTTGPKQQQQIFLGDKRIAVSHLALHSKPVPPEDLPRILPDEDY